VYQPPSEYDVVGKHWQDLNTGCIYELDEDFDSPTFGTYTEVYCPEAGGGGGYTPDIIPPPVPEVLSAASEEGEQADGTTAVRITASVGYSADPSIDDLAGYTVQFTNEVRSDDPTQPDWVYATEINIVSPDTTGLLPAYATRSPVMPGSKYWIRVAARDKAGNRSDFSTPPFEITAANDTAGPPQPTITALLPGFKAFGLRVDPSTAADWSYNEVRWRAVGDTEWLGSAKAKATIIGVAGLTNEVTYEVQVRSVDLSGNTLHDTGTVDGDGFPVYETVKADTEPDKGWVDAGTVTPSAIPADEMFWSEAIIEDLFAGNLSADWITSGSITVGGGGNADGIIVLDSAGREIGRWDENGLSIVDPANDDYQMLIKDSSLVILDKTDPANPIERVSITPLGIDAASITFGSARGGHNLIPNSSFELGQFGASQITTYTWTAAADWNATRIGSDTNITTGTGDLKMTAVT
jgi:hypothetical protein